MRRIALFAPLLLATLSTSAFAADAESKPSVPAEGTATRLVAPTQAIWEFSVNGTSDDIEDALKDAQATRNAMVEALKKAGIAPGNIQVGHCTYAQFGGTTALSGSSFSKTSAAPQRVQYAIVAIQEDLGAVEKTLVALCKVKGAGISLRYSNPEIEKIRREVRIEAVKLAKARAQEMAEALGETIGAAKKVAEVKAQAAPMAGGTLTHGTLLLGRIEDLAGPPTKAPALPESIAVSVSVEAEFELIPEGKK